MTCNTHLCFLLTTHLLYGPPMLLIKKQNSLTGYCYYIQVDPFGPCERSRTILTARRFTLAVPVIKEASRFHHILIFRDISSVKLRKVLEKSHLIVLK